MLVCLTNAEFQNAIAVTVCQGYPRISLLADLHIELGHTVRGCPEEAMEITDRVEVKCVVSDFNIFLSILLDILRIWD